jgi:hypothetical protein
MSEFPYYHQPAEEDERGIVEAVDVLVYGATPAGITAAVQAARHGRSVALLEPSRRIGGVSASGLGMTDLDTGRESTIGGITREFYAEQAKRPGAVGWRLDPEVAERVFQQLLTKAGIEPRYTQFVDTVERENTRITAVATERGRRIQPQVVIDASYEGDLARRAGATLRVGREANAEYGERYNGVQLSDNHQFELDIDPYAIPGDSASGLLPGVTLSDVYRQGAASPLTQSYNFRLLVTDDPTRRVPFERPEDFDQKRYELWKRYYLGPRFPAEEKIKRILKLFDPVTSYGEYSDFDKNSEGPFSLDYVGGSQAWPLASYQTRERIFQAHLSYDRGLMWLIGHDPEIPDYIRLPWQRYGLAADKFTDTRNWPPQLYVREAGRLVGENVMREHHFFGRPGFAAEDPVGLASYGLDSHNCQRIVLNGSVRTEGNVQVEPGSSYGISYRSMAPKRREITNLLVPVCLSASHIAHGSIRMEPTFMVLGQSAGTAAHLAIWLGRAVQEVPYPILEKELYKNGQVLRNEKQALAA